MHILSVNVGQSREVTVKNRTIKTGIYKMPVQGPVQVNNYGLHDDVMIEERKMGRENNAVYAYPHEHYAYWQHELGLTEPFPMGQFGENLTISGLLEEEVRIGDIFRFGNTVLQVTHHRIPCHKLNERMGLRFAPMFLASRKVGYYFRVLEEGTITQGDHIELLERDDNSPSMEEFVRVIHYEYWDAEALAHLLGARDLIPAWRESIETKLEQARTASGWHGLRELEIVRREQENENTVSLYLQCAKGKPLPAFRGGQLLMASLGAAGGGSQLRGAYYLSSDPQASAHYRITVRHDPATAPPGVASVSAHLFDLRQGEHIRCIAPHGAVRSLPEESYEKRLPVLVIQGMGIAPVISLLYELESWQSPAILIHEMTADDPPGLLEELKHLVARNPGFQLFIQDTKCGGQVTAAMIHSSVPAALAHCNIEVAGSREFIARLEIELMAYNISPAALITYKIN